MEHIYSFVQNHAVLISGIILFIAYVFIAIEKISKVTIALLGATLTIFLGLVAQDKGADIINPHYFINFIDFNVIFLLVSMMIIVHIASRSGVFNWVAIKILKLTQGRPKIVLLSLAIFTAITSAFLDNVTTVVLIMPITFSIAKKLDISPIPFLVAEIISSNIGGTATLIGDPPNIIIGSRAGFSFMDFIKELTGIICIIFAVVISLLIFQYRKQLKSDPEKMSTIKDIDDKGIITDKPLMIRAMFTLGFVILGFVLHDVIGLSSYLVAMAGASFLLIFEKPEEILHDVEWNTIFFFIGLFVIIGGLEASGGIKLMANGLLTVTHGSEQLTSMVILWGSGILSGIIDNIPYTATMAPLIYQIQLVNGATYAHPLWWCLSLGACLGGNLTLIGAAANVIVSETAAKKGYVIGFMSYLKTGIWVVLVSLLLSSGYIYIRFLMN